MKQPVGSAKMKKSLFKSTCVLIVFFWFAVTASPFTQQETWQKIAPIGESFTVLMPAKALEGTRVVPISNKDSVPGRVFYSLANGKRYIVASFQKTSPDRVPGLSSFQDFIKSFEHSFKTSTDGVTVSLVSDGEISSNESNGKQYGIKLGEHSGVARIFGTDKAFYAVMVIGANTGDPAVDRYLSSFIIGEANVDADLSGVTINSNGDRETALNSGNSFKNSVPEPWPRSASPIIAGILNGKAISLPKPDYPLEARKARDSGIVEVQIVIDEQGAVIKAEASSGPSSLREAAVSAALKARFSPTRLMGQPVKVSGRIIYDFVR